jgi:Uma2 family endonuclease
MRMATKTRPWTRADLDRLPDDGNRYEVLDGALLVTPLPGESHQWIASTLLVELESYGRRHGVGRAYGPGAIPKGKSELQPDILVVPGRLRAPELGWKGLPRPMLVVEVLSDSTRGRDLVLKREAYQRWGIPEYWIVDPAERNVLVVRPEREDERVVDVLRWQPDPRIPPLEVDVAALFG